jgi:Protein of unknown function (DUF2889)
VRPPEPALSAAPTRVTSPLGGLPGRRPGSVRRISSLAIEPAGEWDKGTLIEGIARDSVAGGDDAVTTLRTASVTATLDAGSRLTSAGGNLPAEVIAELVGKSPASGFRKELARLALVGLDPDSLQAAILDDLPTVRLISGYARLIELPPPVVDGRTAAPVLNVCRGWAADGTASRLAASGRSVITGTPAAPAFAGLLGGPAGDPGASFAEPPLRPRSMRRRRVLDLVRAGRDLEVYQYFRDSHVDAGGTEGSLHEYVMTARLSAADLVVREIAVEPRALPFPECRLAAPNAQLLTGVPVAGIEASVRSALSGTTGCTHLNDVLRFLRFAVSLAASLAGPAG